MKRLNQREKVLLAIVAGIVFAFVNLSLLSSLRQKYASVRSDMAARRAELESLQQVLRERNLWETRSQWLQQTQPKLDNANQAGVRLLEEIQQVAKTCNVLLESPELGVVEDRPNARAVTVSVQTKSGWEPLVQFLNRLQQPDQFIVFDSVSLQIDPGDPAQLRGKFRIAKWFAPQ